MHMNGPSPALLRRAPSPSGRGLSSNIVLPPSPLGRGWRSRTAGETGEDSRVAHIRRLTDALCDVCGASSADLRT